jgi:hypothetical protein
MKTSQLTPDLIVTKKGEAKQSGIALGNADNTQCQDFEYETPKSISVKLDPKRYDILKHIGLKQRKTNQKIMVEAFDLWLLNQ